MFLWFLGMLIYRMFDGMLEYAGVISWENVEKAAKTIGCRQMKGTTNLY